MKARSGTGRGTRSGEGERPGGGRASGHTIYSGKISGSIESATNVAVAGMRNRSGTHGPRSVTECPRKTPSRPVFVVPVTRSCRCLPPFSTRARTPGAPHMGSVEKSADAALSQPCHTCSPHQWAVLGKSSASVLIATCVKPLPLYKPRNPQESDLWRLLDRHFETFQQV